MTCPNSRCTEFRRQYDECPKCGNAKKECSAQCNDCRYRRPIVEQPVEPSIRLIALTRNQVAIVDAKDYERLNQYRWQAVWHSCSGTFYAERAESLPGHRTRKIYMHREILGLGRSDKEQVDHIDPKKTLDNRRQNLRVATAQQNRCNSSLRRDNVSGFKGVFFNKRCKKYEANIGVFGTHIYLGQRDAAEAAWRELYVPAAKKYHGEFARVG